MKVAVSEASGLIGSALVPALQNDRRVPTALAARLRAALDRALER